MTLNVLKKFDMHVFFMNIKFYSIKEIKKNIDCGMDFLGQKKIFSLFMQHLLKLIDWHKILV